MDLGLKGKVAMVAGASRGLGFAVAQALAAEGAIVSISSRNETRDPGCGGAGWAGRRSATAVDVKSADAIQHWASVTIERFGGVDLLFANAGGRRRVRRCPSTTPPGRMRRTCCCSARCEWCGPSCPR